jgi:L-ascorbate metabolism protein UlaG (beta-lactamase superfamily)
MNTSPVKNETISRIAAQHVPAGSIGLWWLGQASLVIRMAGQTVYVDPYLTVAERRLVPPVFTGADVTNADLVLVTHDHGDHLDPEAIPLIAQASPQAGFIAPRPLGSQFRDLVPDAARIELADAGKPIQRDSLEIIPVIAKHEEFDEVEGVGFPYLGYVLRAEGISVYIAGDTIPYDGLVESLLPHAIDLAILPINGRDYFRTKRGTIGNFNVREAAELALVLGADTVIPVHFGMFAGNTVPPGSFVDFLQTIAPHIHAHYPALFRP